MAPKNPEWRYGHAGDSMPWYPSVRLIRQQRESDWRDVIATVESRLRERRAAVADAAP
jgi:hypothetical protein